MPKKAKPESQAEQSERFKRDVQKLIDAGELNPTEADQALDNLVRRSRTA
jgi:polyhydroxyalkanoate synthesis regulator phasin